MIWLSERNDLRDDVRQWVRALPRTISNAEDVKQLVRSSGSVAANQIEADNALGEQDRLMKFPICRKEARESGLWIRLLDAGTADIAQQGRTRLNDEAAQLVKIYPAIINRLGG